MTNTEKEIRQHGIDQLDDQVGVDGAELHNALYNTDYFTIGTYEATQELEEYGTFAAIGKIQQYEQDNFGEVTTDLTDPEKVVNMLAYIIGEEMLGESETLAEAWDRALTAEDLAKIKAEVS